ncbi:MAG: hypothetical protein PHF56_14910 [Desulfuromonadaceae bacterium]|nr:hypothetical protein [Desulfuromonadaceae bacterium]
MSKYFQNDINIALVNRDWNIYEVNSIVDTEKITYHLSEVIIFVLGLIYCQYREFIEDSVVILEQLFAALGTRSNGDQITIDNEKQEMTMSPNSLRTGRLLAILTTIYKNIGIDFTNEDKFNRAHYYLSKYLHYNKNDIHALSAMALCSFRLNDIASAQKYTDHIGKIDKSSQFYILNQAFFGIHEKNYASATHFYKEISKRGVVVGPDVITGVIAFLDRMYRNDRKEIAYEFAIGILNKHHCQYKAGLSELRKFIKMAKKKDVYNEMVAYAIFETQRKK